MIANLLAPDVHAAFDDAILLVGLIAGVVALFKFPYRSFVKWIRGKETASSHAAYVINTVIPTLVAAHDDMDVKFDFILQELKPNHGTSIRDAIDRIEHKVDGNKAMILAGYDFEERAMYMVETDNKLVWTNRAYRELLGADSVDLLGYGYMSFFLSSERAKMRQTLRELAEQQAGSLTELTMMCHGKPTKLLAHTTHLVDMKGERVGSFGYMEPLSELHRRKEEAE